MLLIRVLQSVLATCECGDEQGRRMCVVRGVRLRRRRPLATLPAITGSWLHRRSRPCLHLVSNAALGKTWTSVPARQAADGSSRAGDTQVSGDWAP